jgi:tetratricopeptide (TPR) repeat protein
LTLSQAFGPIGGQYRRPLVLLSYRLQAAMGAASPSALHLANALMHGACAALMVVVLSALETPPVIAAAAALLFAFHPLTSGSVAYISGRTDLLATLMTLACAAAVLAPEPDVRRETVGDPPVGGLDRPAMAMRLLTAAAAALAAGLAKESGIVAGPLAAMLWWWQRRRQRQPQLEGPTLMAPALALLGSAAAAALVWPASIAASVPLGVRLRAVATAAAEYLRLLVWPAALHLDRLTPTLPPGYEPAGAAVVAAMLAAPLLLAQKPTRGRLAACALVLLYLPASGLVPVYPAIADRYVFTGEQFLYAPIIVIAAVVATLASRRLAPAAVLAACCVVAAAWAPSLLARQKEFADAAQVYRKTLAYSPSSRACFNLGNTLLAGNRSDDAEKVYRQCIEIAPDDAQNWGQLAIALQGQGRDDEASGAYVRATTLDPASALLWSNFATLDANAGRYGAAREKWYRALSIDPQEQSARAALLRLDNAGR